MGAEDKGEEAEAEGWEVAEGWEAAEEMTMLGMEKGGGCSLNASAPGGVSRVPPISSYIEAFRWAPLSLHAPPPLLLTPLLLLVAVLAELQDRMTDSRLSYRQRRKLEAAMASEDDEAADCDPTHCMVDFLAAWAGKLLLRVPLLTLGMAPCSRACGDASECR